MRLFSCYYEIYNKICVITMNKINKKAKRLNSIRGDNLAIFLKRMAMQM